MLRLFGTNAKLAIRTVKDARGGATAEPVGLTDGAGGDAVARIVCDGVAPSLGLPDALHPPMRRERARAAALAALAVVTE
ncbi:MAG: hypothetical protein ACR2KI_08755 [Candidatus Limnocylindria bacterium]